MCLKCRYKKLMMDEYSPQDPFLCRVLRSWEGFTGVILTFAQDVGDYIEKRFLNSKEIARFLGLSEPCIRDWIKLKKIPYVKLGKAVRFDLEIIESWLKDKQINNKVV